MHKTQFMDVMHKRIYAEVAGLGVKDLGVAEEYRRLGQTGTGDTPCHWTLRSEGGKTYAKRTSPISTGESNKVNRSRE